MKRVYKYEVPINDRCAIMMPVGARLLHLAEQDGAPCLWALVDPVAPVEARHFRLAGTGHDVDCHILAYVGTVLLRGGALVFHLFEVAP